MLTKNLNISEGLVNGAIGTVLAIEPTEENEHLMVCVKFRSNNYEEWIKPMKFTSSNGAKAKQIPLKLAWGMSIHKSQGMTLDYVKVSLGKLFADGQGYVALSRCTSLEGLSIIGKLDFSSITSNNKVNAFYKTLEPASKITIEKDSIINTSTQKDIRAFFKKKS